MAKAAKFNYSKAVKEIEVILQEIENGELEVDLLAEKVKKASELIKLCKQKLKKTEEELGKNLDNGDDE